MIAEIRMNMIVVDLHIVYIDTVMYIKLQLDNPISTAADTAEKNCLSIRLSQRPLNKIPIVIELQLKWLQWCHANNIE